MLEYKNFFFVFVFKIKNELLKLCNKVFFCSAFWSLQSEKMWVFNFLWSHYFFFHYIVSVNWKLICKTTVPSKKPLCDRFLRGRSRGKSARSRSRSWSRYLTKFIWKLCSGPRTIGPDGTDPCLSTPKSYFVSPNSGLKVLVPICVSEKVCPQWIEKKNKFWFRIWNFLKFPDNFQSIQ